MSRNAHVGAIRALCAAWETGGVYGRTHAGYRRAMERCAAALAPLTQAHGALTLAICNDGLIAGSHLLTDRLFSEKTGPGLFGMFSARGITLLRLGKGVSADDIEWLLQIDQRRPGSSSPSGSVHLGAIDEARARQMLAAARSTAAVDADDEADIAWSALSAAEAVMPLKTAWTSLLAGAEALPSAVGELAANIATAVVSMRSHLPPLLQLKDHDEYTFVHAVNVGLIAGALARAAGMSGEALRELAEAALLHDIGKRLVPLLILNKKSGLDQSELTVMRQHPILGASLLSRVRGVKDLSVVIAYEHHLRIDGGGYPLSSRRRPPALASQLVQVADIFDALRSDRPYRRGCETKECLEIMARESGSAFDRDLFNVLVDLVNRNTGKAGDGFAAAEAA